MEDGRISDHRFPNDLNFNTFHDNHKYRAYLQQNAARIISETQSQFATSHCSDNLPFKTAVKWSVTPAVYQYRNKPHNTIKYT
jgi:hypothetical protein